MPPRSGRRPESGTNDVSPEGGRRRAVPARSGRRPDASRPANETRPVRPRYLRDSVATGPARPVSGTCRPGRGAGRAHAARESGGIGLRTARDGRSSGGVAGMEASMSEVAKPLLALAGGLIILYTVYRDLRRGSIKGSRFGKVYERETDPITYWFHVAVMIVLGLA